MARRIPIDIRTVSELSNRVEFELGKLDMTAHQGYIGKSRLVNPDNSYLFMSAGVLKYYNAVTGEEKTVTVT